MPDGGEGGLKLRTDHREVEEEEEEVGTREEEEEKEEDDLEKEEGKSGGEPARPLETLERRAQTSSSNCLTSRCRGRNWGTMETVKMTETRFKILVLP